MFLNYKAGDHNGIAGCAEGNGQWAARRPGHACAEQWRRHVTADHGSACAVGLQGVQGRRPWKHLRPDRASRPRSHAGNPLPPAGSPMAQGRQGGGLSDWLGGAFGGAMAGGATGSILSGGLNELLRRFQQSGQGNTAQSWISTGPNETISPGDLERAAGVDTLDELARETGVSRNELLDQLSNDLPRDVDSLTPDGRIPTETEASRWA